MQTVWEVESLPLDVLDRFPALDRRVGVKVPNYVHALRIIVDSCLLVVDKLVVYKEVLAIL
jgi:hypothetical protein